MKAIEAFQIAERKKSLRQIDFIIEAIRTKANNGEFKAFIYFEPTAQTVEHFEKLGYLFEKVNNHSKTENWINWEIKNIENHE